MYIAVNEGFDGIVFSIIFLLNVILVPSILYYFRFILSWILAVVACVF